jgi:hypothetical protein
LVDWWDLLNRLVLRNNLRDALNDGEIGRFFGKVDFNFTIRHDIIDFVITSEFILIIVLDLDEIILLDFVFIDEFLDDELLDFLDGFG